jgi:uroporphyrinogen III methyltransferase/synthase
MAPVNAAQVRVAVTRAAPQADSLTVRLRDAGFDPVAVPVIDIAEPADDGAALRAAARRLRDGAYAWVVVTSVNGAERMLAAAAPPWPARVAAIGSATAASLTEHGLTVDLVPPRFVAESLVESFPNGPSGPQSGKHGPHSGGLGQRTVLLPRAAVAREVLPEGLRAKGWTVDVVEAYRTTAPAVDDRQRREIAACAVVTFTSPSTVHNFVDLIGLDHLPPTVACIGPVTADACRSHGIAVHVEAQRHTIDGLVAALVEWQKALLAEPRQGTIDR